MADNLNEKPQELTEDRKAELLDLIKKDQKARSKNPLRNQNGLSFYHKKLTGKDMSYFMQALPDRTTHLAIERNRYREEETLNQRYGKTHEERSAGRIKKKYRDDLVEAYAADFAEGLSKELESNTVLTNLTLTHNYIGDVGAKYIARVLKVNKAISNISVKHNHIGDDGAEHLAGALKDNKTLTDFDLRYNRIGDAGAKYLGGVLRVNSTLANINLGLNNINTLGAGHLANALKDNKTLEKLSLSANNIGDGGAKYFPDYPIGISS